MVIEVGRIVRHILWCCLSRRKVRHLGALKFEKTERAFVIYFMNLKEYLSLCAVLHVNF